MNNYSVRHQLVDFRANQSRPAGTVDEEGLVSAFLNFPFASELKRAEDLKGDITYPTITFKRESDGEEMGIWTDDAERFDLCLTRNATKKFLRSLTAPEVEVVLAQFKTKSVPEIVLKREEPITLFEGAAPEMGQGVVFYNSQWQLGMIFAMIFPVGVIYLALNMKARGLWEHFCEYSLIAFAILFSLFFWQEGRKKGSVKLKDIAAIYIDFSPPQPGSHFDGITRVYLELSNGRDAELPPNFGNVLRARNWRIMRELAAHIQKFSPTMRVNAGRSDYNSSAKKK
jgi:hypothetical protein